MSREVSYIVTFDCVECGAEFSVSSGEWAAKTCAKKLQASGRVSQFCLRCKANRDHKISTIQKVQEIAPKLKKAIEVLSSR